MENCPYQHDLSQDLKGNTCISKFIVEKSWNSVKSHSIALVSSPFLSKCVVQTLTKQTDVPLHAALMSETFRPLGRFESKLVENTVGNFLKLRFNSISNSRESTVRSQG